MEHAVGGLRDVIHLLRKLLVWPKTFAREGDLIGVTWPSGLLLHGPPGVGKSLVIRAACEEVGAHMRALSPTSVFGAFVGESEKKLREIFQGADDLVQRGEDVVLFFDEIDVLCPRRDRSGPFECRLVAQVLTLMDTSIAKMGHGRDLGRPTGVLLLVGATSNPNAVDPAIRRPGRLEKEVGIGMPDLDDRVGILRVYLERVPLSPEVEVEAIGRLCSGFTGADIAALCQEAAFGSMERAAGEADLSPLVLADFERARMVVRPTVTRGIVREVDWVSWEDICGLEEVKRELVRVVQWPITHPEAFDRLGLQSFRGAMLYGPPGCCKTKLCQAAACTGNIPLISLSCAEVLSMYVGESEEKLRHCFVQARLSAPCIIFLDEFDAFCAKRGGGNESAGSVGDKLLATFLTEMDGLEQVNGVIVLAATNKPQDIDAALLRPGRFDMVVYVPPPNLEERALILRYLTEGMECDGAVDFDVLAGEAEGLTGAELEALCREAYLNASSTLDRERPRLTQEDFEDALAAMSPMLTREEIETYERFRADRKA